MSKLILGEAQRLLTNRKQDLEKLLHTIASSEIPLDQISSTLSESSIRQEWRTKREHELLENVPELPREQTK